MSDHKARSKKRILLIVMGVVGLVVVAVGLGVLVRLLQNTIQQQGANKQTVALEAQDLRLQGSLDEAGKKIDDALNKSTTSDEDKYSLYIQQGSLLEDQGKSDEAVASYEKAAAIKESQDIYTLIGDTYKQLGNKDKAIEAYKKAIGLIPQDNPVAEDDKASLEQKINSLGGQP